VVVDHQPPRMRRARARRRPEAAGHPNPPLSHSSSGSGGPPGIWKSLCGCLPRGHARCSLTPPPSRGSETLSGGLPPEHICVVVGPSRPRDLVQPPPLPLRSSVSVLDGPPQPGHRMVVMAPREPSIVPTLTGPQEPRSRIMRRERCSLYACLSDMSDPVSRGPQ